LQDTINSLISCPVQKIETGKDLKDSFACDACVTVTKFTETETNQKKKIQAPNLNLQRVAKLIVTDQDWRKIKPLIPRFNTYETVELLRRWRIVSLAHQNFHLQGITIPLLEQPVIYEKERNRVQKDALRTLLPLFDKNNIKFVVIKGSRNAQLYPEGFDRHFSDVDILFQDFDNFMHVITLLLQHGFKIIHELGMAFSIKKANVEGKCILTGHAHVEKRIDGYNMGIDIAFPNLPLGTDYSVHTSIWLDDITHTQEDLFLLALTHLFKHSIPSIKDINDLYLLSKQSHFDWNYLFSYAVKNNSKLRLCLLLFYLQKEYKNTTLKHRMKLFSLFERSVPVLFLFIGWPYSILSHTLFKKYERLLMRYKRKKHNNQIALQKHNIAQTISHVLGRNSLLKSDINGRIYWIPIFTFYDTSIILVEKLMNNRKEWICHRFSEIKSTCLISIINNNVEVIVTNFGIYYLTTSLELDKDIFISLRALARDIVKMLNIESYKDSIQEYIVSKPIYSHNNKR